MNDIEILLVEDNPNDAELAIRALQKDNLANRTMHVRNGQEALDFLTAKGFFAHREEKPLPSLILLDLNMPNINGIEVLRILKSDERLSHIPVMILSTSNHWSDIEQCIKLGAVRYFQKPIEYNAFIKIIDEISYWLRLHLHSAGEGKRTIPTSL